MTVYQHIQTYQISFQTMATQRVLVHSAATGELRSTVVLPLESTVADLIKELETDPLSAISILHEDRAMTAEEKLPHGDEISVQLLLQNVIGRWTRRVGIKPEETEEETEEIHDYKEEILLLRKDGQGRFKRYHSWVKDSTSYGSDQMLIGCFTEDLKDDEDMQNFLNSSATGASWQLGRVECEPVLYISGAGWMGRSVIEDDDLVAHGAGKFEQEWAISLRELQDSWEFCSCADLQTRWRKRNIYQHIKFSVDGCWVVAVGFIFHR